MGYRSVLKKQMIGLVAVLTLTACSGGVSEFNAGSSTTNVVDWSESEMSATTPIIADGITPSTIKIILRDKKRRPIKGYRPSIRVVGTLSAMSPCTISDEDGESGCWIKSHIPGARTIQLDEPGANLQSAVVFEQMPPMQALYAIVSSGDVQALPNGHHIVSASGNIGTDIDFKDSNQVVRLKTSHFSTLEEL